jgi:hypothetical protein
MGLLDWFRKSGKKETDKAIISTSPAEKEQITNVPKNEHGNEAQDAEIQKSLNVYKDLKETITHSAIPSQIITGSENVVSFVKDPLFKFSGTIQLQIEDYLGWDDLFVTGKTTEKLPGFDFRSRRKVKLRYFGVDCFIVEVNNILYIIRPNNSKKICFECSSNEPLKVEKVDEKCAILSLDDLIGYLDFDTGLITLYQFNWHPFRFAIGKEFWLVSTRETTEGPGELYCFSCKRDYSWGIRFGEEFQTGFGVIKATGYHLLISEP